MNLSPKYCRCGEEINPARLALGNFVCIECGEEKAQKRRVQLSKSIVPSFSKGAYTLVRDKKELLNLDPKHKL